MLNSPDSMTDLDDVSRSPPFIRLMTSVGLLMFHWSRLEAALIEDIRRLRTESGGTASSNIRVRGSASERVAEWRALLSLKSRRNPRLSESVLQVSNRLERLRQKRGAVAQNFVGASLEGEPHILCSTGGAGATSELTRITGAELEALIEEMDRCADQIRRIETD